MTPPPAYSPEANAKQMLKSWISQLGPLPHHLQIRHDLWRMQMLGPSGQLQVVGLGRRQVVG